MPYRLPQPTGWRMEGTYRTELENDGTSLLVMVNATDRLRLKLAIPWEQITAAVAQEIRARVDKGDVALHFVGAPDGMRFPLRDLTESWASRFDPHDARSLAERDELLTALRDCVARIEATAPVE
jgi:hypothetical protein